LFVLLFTLSFQAEAQIPQLINYQGRLVGTNGLVNGNVGLSLRLYNVPNGGSFIYEDSNSVAVADGLYSTSIGDNPTNASFLAAFTNATVYLEVAVNGAALAPRERIVAVAYAMTADGVRPQGILSNMIATGAISANHLADGAISNADIATNAAIAAGKIAGGPGSGLDADTLDGINSTSFSQTNHNHDATYVNEGQTNSVTTQMITDGTLLFVDVGQNGATNGQVMTWNNGASRWEPATPATGGGGGTTNLFWHLGGNTGVVSGTHFLGTLNSNTVQIRVDNQVVMRFEPNLYANIVGGNQSNFINKTAYGSIIAGGGHDTYPNVIHQDGNHAAILGGWGNVIGTNAQGSGIGAGYQNAIGKDSDNSLIGGGQQNWIAGPGDYSTIGGGRRNQISGSQPDGATIGGGTDNSVGGVESTVAGGGRNTIGDQALNNVIGGGDGNQIRAGNSYDVIAGGFSNSIGDIFAVHDYSAIGGGAFNSIANKYAMIPGGSNNAATGIGSFAAGMRAKAQHNGAFVWGDNTAADISSTNNNSWTVRVNGGVRFTSGATNLNQSVKWAPGSGSWDFSSDRNLKENFSPVDEVEVLEKLAKIPMTVWNYKGYDQQHMGPMAQDFHREFGLASTETTLNSLDLDGVTIAAIQGLYEVVKEQRAEIDRLREEVNQLKQEGKRELAPPEN